MNYSPSFPRWFWLSTAVFLSAALLFFVVQPSYAALGWVGNMFPGGGSSNTINAGDTFDIYLQVYKGGTTEASGQGADITCTLYWSEVNSFGGSWLSPTSTTMSYVGDVGNNDEYQATISPTAGLYEFTGYCTDTMDNTDTWQTSGNGQLTVNTPGPITVSDSRALWLDANTMAWNGTAGSSYKLLYDPDGGLVPATAESTACSFPLSGPCYVDLVENGTVSGYAKNPNTTGLPQLDNTLMVSEVRELLRGQTAVAAYDGGGALIDLSGIQIQSVLDDVYTTAVSETLGVSYSGGVPSVSLWAPTAQNVDLLRFVDATTIVTNTHTMSRDATTGIWSVTGAGGWDRDYYLFAVDVYVPSEDAVVTNIVSDPYALTLSADTAADPADPRSQFVNLNDADLKPDDWDTLTKPTLEAFEDITVYEMHIRDFSINDSTVITGDRGTYMAFTYDGAGPDPNTASSDGMDHLLQLRDAGLTHVHLLPTFDIASVPEENVARTVDPAPTGYARDSAQPQAVISATRAVDGFNWGYDPYHYGAVEGSYSTNPADGTQRVLEFRRMVSALNQNDLRVVMDVVYNHTAAAGQDDKSVLDKIVPGYYYRYDLNGVGQNSSCCADTATEYAMMEKLMIDTVERFAVDYKVDGFRFDLMNLHTRRNMEKVRTAVDNLTIPSDGVDGSEIYIYGEGWDFGSAAGKGLTTCPDCYARQANMTGSGIGTFNDKLRDAAHGGYNTDPLQIRAQGFINGLSYDWNGYAYFGRFQADLHNKMNILRSALRGSGTDWSGAGSPYTADPQESVPYVSKHDNETLYDQNVFKLSGGTSMADRVRAQNMGHSLVGLSQGIPFFHMGSDILRSKSLDRNSYDSGDWFNRVFWDRSSNNFGQGLPPAWDNETRWGIMSPLLSDTSLDPAVSDMDAAAAHLREILRLRSSSRLFRLQTEAEVNGRTQFYNGDNDEDGLIVMGLLDDGTTDWDSNYESILVIFNADKLTKTVNIPGANNFSLHPIQADGTDADPVVQTAVFDDGTDTFTVPPRTTAVFVSADLISAPLPDSSLGFVGLMFPRGGVATQVDEGGATGDFNVYVQVYEEGVTDAVGQGSGIGCYLHWGRYGTTWTDTPMSYNVDTGDGSPPPNDEYVATISTADLNNLAPGNYGFTTYCQKPGEAKFWKQDVYNINSSGDDDQGDGIITVVPALDPMPAPDGGTFVHLFEWPWPDIEKECTYLSQTGYTAVQVSPPAEHIIPTADQGGQISSQYPWWVRYQSVTHDAAKLDSRSGTLAEFQSMVQACGDLGIDIYVDAVFNHMADIEVGSPPTGTAGTEYESGMPGRFYGTQYAADDFHIDCDINSYNDRAQVQECRLSGLPDLDTGRTAVQDDIHTYLQDLLDMGVDGFRIDGAKHMPSHEIAAVVDGLTVPGGGQPYLFHEVIDPGTERVRDWEYAPYGDVTEFAYSIDAMSKFNTGTIADLRTVVTYTGMMDSRFAVVFTDNHDNQRGHGPGGGNIVDHRDGAAYDLANVFMLAHPYGYPKVMSSYYWSNNPADDSRDSYGPPGTNDGGTTWGAGLGPDTRPVYGAAQTAGDDPANCAAVYEDGKWVCEHRRAGIAGMVGFRAATAGEPLTDWWDDGAETIAFGRAAAGFVVINNGAAGTSRLYQTGLPQGTYCNVAAGNRLGPDGCVTGDTVTVDSTGRFTTTVSAHSAVAVHIRAKEPTTIPQAPQAFTAVISDTSLLLDWATVTETITFDYTVTDYTVYRSADPYFDPGTCGCAEQTNEPDSAYTDSGAVDGMSTWFYIVHAQNQVGDSADSAEVGVFNFAIAPGD